MWRVENYLTEPHLVSASEEPVSGSFSLFVSSILISEIGDYSGLWPMAGRFSSFRTFGLSMCHYGKVFLFSEVEEFLEGLSLHPVVHSTYSAYL